MTSPDYQHLEQLIELLRADLRTAVGEIKASLASRVDVAVYAADQRRIEQDIGNVRADLSEVKEERARDHVDHRADRRMIISSLVGAGLSLLVALVVLVIQSRAI